MDRAINFIVGTYRHFIVEHCYDCRVPGYLIVRPQSVVLSLADLAREAQAELGSVLASTVEAVRQVLAPVRVYCAVFGEESQQLHFHVFPRTAEVTAEFLRAFPDQRDLIHGPVLLDWARSHYRAPKAEVWQEVWRVIGKLQEELQSQPDGE